MKFSLFIDTDILKEYFYIKKNYLSRQSKLYNILGVIIIFLLLIGIVVVELNVDPDLKVFLVLLLSLMLLMYITYLITRYQYFHSVKQMVKKASSNYLYNVEAVDGLIISEDNGVNKVINVSDVTDIYQSRIITIVSDHYNDIVFCNDDFDKMLEEYPELKSTSIKHIDVPDTEISKKV